MIRKARIDDLEAIWNLRVETTALLKARGIDQWQYIEPSKNQFLDDIHRETFFVYEHEGIICGMIFIMRDKEPTYEQIDGDWHYDLPYITIHRLAVKQSYLNSGISKKLIEFSKQYAKENDISLIRIDTHRNNKQAIRLFTNQGFILCGHITLSNKVQGDRDRLAFDLYLGDEA